MIQRLVKVLIVTIICNKEGILLHHVVVYDPRKRPILEGDVHTSIEEL